MFRFWRLNLSLMGWLMLWTGLDQLSKWMARVWLNPLESWSLVPGIFQLTLTHNTGAAFSLLAKHPAFLTVFTGIIFLVLLTYGLCFPSNTRFDRLALGLILGGALGNWIDRLLWGRVTDFLDVVLIHYPVFNLADTFIFCGVVFYFYGHFVPIQRLLPAETSEAHGNTPPTVGS